VEGEQGACASCVGIRSDRVYRTQRSEYDTRKGVEELRYFGARRANKISSEVTESLSLRRLELARDTMFCASLYIMKPEEKFETIKEIVDDKISERKSDTKLRNYLYIMYGPFENYTESIILLCKKEKLNAASVILRSLVEAHINIIYMQIGDQKKHLAEAAYEGFKQKVSVCDNFLALIKKYPNLESQDHTSLYNINRLNDMKEFAVRGRDSIPRLNDVDVEYKKVDLITKARRCDESRMADTKPGFFEDLYTLQYRYLSPLAHLNIEGLQRFVDEKDGVLIHKDGSQKEMIQGTAIGLYAALVKDLYENGVISGEVPAEVDELLK